MKKAENFLEEQDHRMLIKNTLQDHDKLMSYLHILFPITGMGDKMFCNGFMMESVELLKHGIFLYEEGYFDCAFYSVRQSIENMNNMLFFSQNEKALIKWRAKERFPSDHQIKERLRQINTAYSEIKEAIPEVFEHYEELLKKSNKYIHKQGFDTFYIGILQHKSKKGERTQLFIEFLKQSIGLVMVMNIILDPLSLALSDPEIDAHILFNPMAEPIPIGIFEEIFENSILEKIKKTNFYKEFIEFFLEKEEMNEATYDVIRSQYFNVEALEDIESQADYLNCEQSLCLEILKAGIQVSHFYFQDDFWGYITSIEPLYQLSEYRSDQFDQFMVDNGRSNIRWKGMLISVYNVFDTYIVLQHNELFTEENLFVIQTIIDKNNLSYDQLKAKLDEIQ
ncbi:MAG: hypothetical protein EGP68_00400 [Lachnospiraceae bacterium]|nr:hypothetical protein [Lachnospiraceae bacterium]